VQDFSRTFSGCAFPPATHVSLCRREPPTIGRRPRGTYRGHRGMATPPTRKTHPASV
jgi:hypothetical protein